MFQEYTSEVPKSGHSLSVDFPVEQKVCLLDTMTELRLMCIHNFTYQARHGA
jgi:hypothetical protein